MIPVFDRIENIVGKGENAGSKHFLLFPQCFQKTFSPIVQLELLVLSGSFWNVPVDSLLILLATPLKTFKLFNHSVLTALRLFISDADRVKKTDFLL